MIVVAIIGILAAIALPAYQDYITRAKVTELVVAADACKTSISEYYQTLNAYPPTLVASGCANVNSKYISALAVGAGTGIVTVTALTGAGALDVAAAGNIVLTPAPTATGSLDWTCTASTIAKKYLPANCR